ncbi:MAG TPA: methionyl-tRNA formyltransferase [Solirubrobacteraceae bacterium]|jgi:methionyl-tRNA formyltransferase|nr:methionyl-tRNA formyltransferase [Solirubrobacteraceae bacterium]
MRTVFLGTSDFAAAVLARLAGEQLVKGQGLGEGSDLGEASDPGEGSDPGESEQLGRAYPARHRPVLVLTRPDRPAGRGRRLASPPVADAARMLGLELAQPQSVNDPAVREAIASLSPDALVVCAFGALIKEPLLSGYEMLNLHPSLLPRWRGAAPIERAIMAGDERTGTSIMRLTAGLDSGPVCLTASEPIRPDDTFGSLAARLERTGGELLVSVLDMLEGGEQLPFAEQDERLVTYAEKIGPADRLLDPSRPAAELERVVRALNPHIGTRVALPDGTQLGVRRSRLASLPGSEDIDGVYAHEGKLLLGCADGALELLEVQPAGKRSMDAGAFLRGRGLPSP